MKTIEKIYSTWRKTDVLLHKAVMKRYPPELREMIENVETLEEFLSIPYDSFDYDDDKVWREAEEEVDELVEFKKKNKRPWERRFYNMVFGRASWVL